MWNKRSVHIHFIGIGGIGMSGLAEVLLSLGQRVSGSDLNQTPITERLQSKGAIIYTGHQQEHVKGAQVIVFSSAIDETNPEIIEAKRSNIPLMKRAEMVAEIMRLKHGIAVAGTHGKTTTTSILATILKEGDFDPTYIIGGIVSNLDGHAKVGEGPTLVVEADESDGSFLLLNPIMSVITNVDFDHLDFYQSKENIVKAFSTFANGIPFYGMAALNAHDAYLMEISKTMRKPWCSFGIDDGSTQADFLATDIHIAVGKTTFTLLYKGEKQVKISLALIGKHNVLNTLGAIAIAHHMGLSFEQIAKGIAQFQGVDRRFQLLFENEQLEIIDDYAHHPTEIKATLESLQNSRPNRTLIALFEPHRFSRTKECWPEFLHCFNFVDEAHLLPIYPASEKPIPEIQTQRLVEDINKIHPKLAHFIATENLLKERIDQLLSRGEKVSLISLGAGSIGRRIRQFVKAYYQ